MLLRSVLLFPGVDVERPEILVPVPPVVVSGIVFASDKQDVIIIHFLDKIGLDFLLKDDAILRKQRRYKTHGYFCFQPVNFDLLDKGL